MSYLWYWPDGGWDFAAWKARQSWEPVVSEQSGAADPLPLLPDCAPEERLERWERARSGWQAVSAQMLGSVTDVPPATMVWEHLGDEFVVSPPAPGHAYAMRRLRYSLTDEEWGYAWLLTPSDAAAPRPAVIALHQTTASGKAEVVGLETTGDVSHVQYAAELAARGFVVLAPDAIAFGERQAGHANARYRSAAEFFAAHPDGSVMAKMAFDVSRAVDLLHLLPQADASRIGCIGHSHGAYGTLFAMLAEPRIAAGVVSCGLNLLRRDPSPHRWWSQTALIPRLGLYAPAVEQTPLDFHHWLALVAPRPLMVVAGTRDAIFPDLEEARWLDGVREVYAAYGAESSFVPWVFDGPHTFPPAARHQAYRMLTDALGPTDRRV
ncbi:Dienelactone hydrolase family protein [Actinopolymorpha cephalotaxi]|uniref:Dienelactone hydrolase n=1 Tax=Actinopolymorpha cephalotaxi TaxID=504797 RepID=A0A1I2L9S7_9ACTN|nr:dienelactone hydrolase family protein [Actinopolymorpha cephalotaxi]NYH84994.1 dienelactone hydrolase [Actinopolymorpha cephalotaxi]SFF76122.1 Dienelactone hydrolase family protein [Actinopolymorpha cephalotaxi]